MTCAGCEKRKGWIRRWLGFDDKMTAMARVLQKYTDRRCHDIVEAGADLEERVNEITDWQLRAELRLRELEKKG